MHRTSRFDFIAACYTVMLYHIVDGTSAIRALYTIDLYPSSWDEYSLGSADILSYYIPLCLAAFFFGGHVYGTAITQQREGRFRVSGLLILISLQLLIAWCLFAAVFDRKYMPTTTVFFSILAVKMLWSCVVHIDALLFAGADDRTSNLYDNTLTPEKAMYVRKWVGHPDIKARSDFDDKSLHYPEDMV